MRGLHLVPLLVLGACRAPVGVDSGAWTTIDSPTEASLRGVAALGDGVVWASGSEGTVLRSLDGGATWDLRTLPGGGDARDVEALDSERAWAITITEPARVLRTQDGGETWDVVHESDDPRSFFDSLALLRRPDGALAGALVFGDPHDGHFEVLRSEDGVRFEPVLHPGLVPAADGEAAFAASGTCIVADGADRAWIGTGGARARVLATRDGGRTWSAADAPVRQGAATTGIYTVAFADARRGVVLGGAYDAPDIGGDNAAWTDDGGATWRAAERAPSGYRSGAAWFPDGSIIAVGRGGGSVSFDGGRTWDDFETPPGTYAVSAAPDGDAWAVGAEGRVLRLVR